MIIVKAISVILLIGSICMGLLIDMSRIYSPTLNKILLRITGSDTPFLGYSLIFCVIGMVLLIWPITIPLALLVFLIWQTGKFIGINIEKLLSKIVK